MTSPKEWSAATWSIIAVAVVGLGMLVWFLAGSGLLKYLFSGSAEETEVEAGNTGATISVLVNDCYLPYMATCTEEGTFPTVGDYYQKYNKLLPPQVHAVWKPRKIFILEEEVGDGAEEASEAAETSEYDWNETAYGSDAVFYAANKADINPELALVVLDAWTDFSYNPASFVGKPPFGEERSRVFYDAMRRDLLKLRDYYAARMEQKEAGTLPRVYASERFGIHWTVAPEVTPATLAVVDFLADKVGSAQQLKELVEGPNNFRSRYLHLTGVDPAAP